MATELFTTDDVQRELTGVMNIIRTLPIDYRIQDDLVKKLTFISQELDNFEPSEY
jgi:hypothetical protein